MQDVLGRRKPLLIFRNRKDSGSMGHGRDNQNGHLAARGQHVELHL